MTLSHFEIFRNVVLKRWKAEETDTRTLPHRLVPCGRLTSFAICSEVQKTPSVAIRLPPVKVDCTKRSVIQTSLCPHCSFFFTFTFYCRTYPYKRRGYLTSNVEVVSWDNFSLFFLLLKPCFCVNAPSVNPFHGRLDYFLRSPESDVKICWTASEEKPDVNREFSFVL